MPKSKKGSSAYRAAYCAQMLSFFGRAPFTCATTEKYDRNGNVTSVREDRTPCEFPTFARFAAEIGVSLGELLAWRKHPSFDRAYLACEALQRSLVIENAMLGRYDSSFAKLFLTSEGQSATAEESPFSVEIRVVEP